MSSKYLGWDWVVRAYYADDVAPPKTPGALAFETVHKGDVSKDMEVSAAKSRADIGTVAVLSAAGAMGEERYA